MVFNSLEFAYFFAIILPLFWLSWKLRILQNIILLGGSMYFYYCFHYSFPLYLAALVLIAYSAAFIMDKRGEDANNKIIYYPALFLLCIGLIYLKYSGLLIGNIKGLSSWQASALHFLVPVGISFYTFSSIGYLTDVYKGKITAEKNIITYATYISFFPTLLLGPIPSAQTVLPQFREKPKLTLDGIDQSIGEILWGLFKKMVVADNISLGVSYCFKRYHELNGLTCLLGVILFFIYLYADFSAYSDIARGTARLLGIDIVKNFKNPFGSTSITDFWRRWHISLANWFFEYVFNPVVIGFRNMGNASIAIGLLVTFGLSGIWHGADWKFGVWGLLHAVAMIYENYTSDFRAKIFEKVPKFLNSAISIFLTLSYAVLAETFFNAASIMDGININMKILSPSIFSVPYDFICKFYYWFIPLIVIELIQYKGRYTFDMEQWKLSYEIGRIIKNKIMAISVTFIIKLLLYAELVIAIALYYKKMNMQEYYYFKF